MNCQMRLWFYSLLLLPGLAIADAPTMTRVLSEVPRVEKFLFCNGGTCADVKTVSLEDYEWQEVLELFEEQMPQSAEEERARIAQAIGLLESIVGPKTGTDTDKGGTFGNSAFPGQLDCNDEATNSTTYMRLMAQFDLLKYHRIEDTKTRGGFLIFGRHSTAAITEIETGKMYAVDSWFYDNGKPAVVLPMDVWLSGWKPKDSGAH
jgi:hypothetical protein